ncbi:hypothetical protein BS47DRAFT_766665 [Hydnum rufescens UP504]|uniref:Uncharacterized protein n=1 Tax=Hydnum rufescens UP504 TaxID=1448309 RepID=A0A9P6DYD2_9AGAM|nr:hypothetical protein BS47DRAFT_766665 [Hydnum rufescens UP504]
MAEDVIKLLNHIEWILQWQLHIVATASGLLLCGCFARYLGSPWICFLETMMLQALYSLSPRHSLFIG